MREVESEGDDDVDAETGTATELGEMRGGYEGRGGVEL